MIGESAHNLLVILDKIGNIVGMNLLKVLLPAQHVFFGRQAVKMRSYDAQRGILVLIKSKKRSKGPAALRRQIGQGALSCP